MLFSAVMKINAINPYVLVSAVRAAHPPAKKAFAALPPSRKKEMVRYLARLKSQAARDRNLARALEVLSGKSGRFMARAWVEGR